MDNKRECLERFYQEWLEQFYQDLMNQQTRYTDDIPPLCLISRERRVSVGTERNYRIEKKIYPEAKLNRKHEFWENGYYKNWGIADFRQHESDQLQTLDELLNNHVKDDAIIIDNTFLEQHQEMNYRAVILTSWKDYILNYFPKWMENQKSTVQYTPTACLVLVRKDGSYFYAAPGIMPNWYNSDIDFDKKTITIKQPYQLPIIETSLTTMLDILKQAGATKAYAMQTINKFDHDETGKRYQVFIQDQRLIYIPCNHYSPGPYYLAWRINNKPLAQNAEGLKLITTSDLQINCILQYGNIEAYLTKRMTNYYADDGEIYYQINPTSKYWTQFFRHIGTQNLNDYFMQTYDMIPMHALIHALGGKKWHFATKSQVEDVPLSEMKMIQPLVKSTGLNKLFTIVQNDTYHFNYLDHNKISALYSDTNTDTHKKYIEIRSYEL